MQILDSIPNTLTPAVCNLLRNGDVFFDIETTGLSWRTSHLYLIGALFFDASANAFLLRQWFLDRPTEEKELLAAFTAFLSGKQRLVHFNGTTFDLPYLEHKLLFYQMENPFPDLEMLDLYRSLRPCQALFSLSSMKQKSLERVLSFSRKDVLDGKQLISVYQDYLQTLDPGKLELLFLHNREDVLGMGAVLELLSVPSFFAGAFSITSCVFSGQALNAVLQPDAKIPVPLSLTRKDGASLVASGSDVLFTLPAKATELKYFFADYRNYYYLPLEDQAVHKSVGAFVDPAHRQKAKAANCYQRKSGIFLPEQEEFFRPAFRSDYKSRPFYFEWNDSFCTQPELLKTYLIAELKLFLQTAR